MSQVEGEVFGGVRGRRGRSGWDGLVAPLKSLDPGKLKGLSIPRWLRL